MEAKGFQESEKRQEWETHEHGLGSQTSLNLSPASLIYWVVLLKLTFHQVLHLQNKNDSTSDTVVKKIN